MTHLSNGHPRLPALGRRGGGWALIQSVLLLGVAAAGLLGPDWPEELRLPRLVAAGVLGAIGAVLFAAGIVSLGPSLTPLPRPRRDAVLKQNGIYATVRHPIYGGVMLIGFAWAFLISPLALIPSGALVIFFSLKARLEERWLAERFPDYPAYARRVRRRFVPYLW